MKAKRVSIFAVAFAAASILPAAFAQRGAGRGAMPASSPRTAPVARSNVILPMRNPVEPMSNPIEPIIPPPPTRSGATRGTNVIPPQSRGNRGGDGQGSRGGDGPGNSGPGQRGRGWNGGVGVPPYYYPTYYYPSYYSAPYYSYYPELYPVTIPGQLPGVPYEYRYPTSSDSIQDEPPVAAPPSSFIYPPQPEVYSEPRWIINEPRPDRVVQRPAIGASRADVVAQLGQPWGTILARGEETLFYDGLAVVIAADGRVSQVR